MSVGHKQKFVGVQLLSSRIDVLAAFEGAFEGSSSLARMQYLARIEPHRIEYALYYVLIVISIWSLICISGPLPVFRAVFRGTSFWSCPPCSAIQSPPSCFTPTHDQLCPSVSSDIFQIIIGNDIACVFLELADRLSDDAHFRDVSDLWRKARAQTFCFRSGVYVVMHAHSFGVVHLGRRVLHLTNPTNEAHLEQ